jgi:hypothetical protein
VEDAVRCEVIDHDRKESTFGHTKKPPNGQKAAKVKDSDDEQRAEAKGEHHAGQDTIRTVDFTRNSEEWGSQHVGYEEYAENQIVLIPFEI